MDEDLKQLLEKIVSENPMRYMTIVKSKKYKFLFDWIEQETPCLSSPEYTTKTKIYWILNDIKSFDDSRCKCKSCGNVLYGKNIDNLNIGYRVCSLKCSNGNSERAEKIRKTRLNGRPPKPSKIRIRKTTNQIIEKCDLINSVPGFSGFLENMISENSIQNNPIDGFASFQTNKIAIKLLTFDEGKSLERGTLLKSSEKCIQLGYQPVIVFEDEWLFKRKIVESRLENIFGKTSRKLFARECKIKGVSFKDASEFLNENHLQGMTQTSKFNLGLFKDDELVSLMTFSSPRFSEHEWEILRFCNKVGCSVVGGASKLFKGFCILKNPKSVVSYADRRWSSGKLYEALGFKFSHKSEPNYSYYNEKTGFQKESRMKFQKHKLKNLLENYNESLTESQNMINNGYFRIYDCGNLVYEYGN